jgi:ankyrin repeat protein
MICSDIFDSYVRLKQISDKPIKKESFDKYLTYYIENKDDKRIEKMKKYIEYGFDVNENISNKKYNWLDFGILNNDIPLIGLLIKNNINIHKIDSNNLNIIFKCVLSNNYILLKYFLNLGVNPNHLNSENDTPLILSCIIKNGYKCVKILLEHPDIQIDNPKQKLNPIDLIINKIELGNKNYLELLEILIKKKKKIEKNDMLVLRASVHYNNLEIVKIFVDNFPSVLNKSSDDNDFNTIVHMAILENHQEMLKYFYTFKQLDWKKKNKEDINYLEYMCYYQMVDLVEIFCEQYPKVLEITYGRTHSIIDNVITMHEYNKLPEDKAEKTKKIIKILIKYGANINYRNEIGYTLIFPSIQYTNEKFVQFMIDIGASIKDKLIRNKEFPPVSNNDPVGFAVQMGKLEIVKVLLNNGGSLHQVEKKNLKLYTAILIAIKYAREGIFNYLITIPEIKSWINSSPIVSNYLFDYAMKYVCLNKNILEKFTPEYKLKSINFDDPIYSVSWNEKRLSIHICDYMEIENKQVILYGLLESVRILVRLSNLNNKNYTVTNENFENLYHCITTSILNCQEIKNIHNDFYEWMEEYCSIISDRLDYHNNHNLKKIFGYVSNIYWEIPDIEEDENCIENTDSDIMNAGLNIMNAGFNPKKYIKKIKKLFKSFQSLKNTLEDYEKEILLIIDKYQTNKNSSFVVYKNKKFIEQDIVIKKLYKLFFPVKQPHYEYMYHSIVYNTDVILSQDINLIVMSENKIKSTLFYIKNNSTPSQWIKTYAPNIGKEDKTDMLHMFPFILDKLLENFTCVQIESIDAVHGGTNYMYYFNGILEYDGEIKTGCYEYFINSKGTLFHRMFRPWNILPDNIKLMITH